MHTLSIRDSRVVLGILTALVFFVLFVLPFLILFGQHLSLAGFSKILLGNNLSLFVRSAALAAGVALLATVFGWAIAFVLNRMNIKGRLFWLLVFSLPLFIPVYIHGVAWSSLLGRHTGINSFLASLLGLETPVIQIPEFLSVIWVLSLAYYPVVLLIATVSLMRWKQEYEGVGMLYAEPAAVFKGITLRYYQAPMMIAALLVFILALSEFSVADLFQVRVYAVEVFVLISGHMDLGSAVMASLLPMLLGLVLLAFIGRYYYRFSAVLNTPNKLPPEMQKEVMLPVQLMFGLLAVIIVFLPLSGLLFKIGSMEVLMRSLNLVWKDLMTSLSISLVAALFITLAATWLAYIYSRRWVPGLVIMRGAWLVLLMIPASIIGLGLIAFWNREGLMGWMYGIGAVVLIGLVARWLPLAAELALASLSQIPRQIEEAAYTAQVKWSSAFRKLILPQMMPALRLVALISFVFCFQELTVTLLLSPPGVSSMPVRLFSTVHYGSEGLVAGLCLWQLLVLALPTSAIFFWGRRYFV